MVEPVSYCGGIETLKDTAKWGPEAVKILEELQVTYSYGSSPGSNVEHCIRDRGGGIGSITYHVLEKRKASTGKTKSLDPSYGRDTLLLIGDFLIHTRYW